MWQRIILKRVLPFVGAAAVAVPVTLWFGASPKPTGLDTNQSNFYVVPQGPGSGASGPCGFDCKEAYSASEPRPGQLFILSKPRPSYTEAARENNVQGTVRLRVTFQADGTIGTVEAVNSLPYGLTEQAKAAARQIQFKPKEVNGKPITVTKFVEYGFAIY
jgi:TonB family protein